MKMETKLKFLVSGVVICLLMAICPSVTAEELANDAKDVPNMTVYESDEIEWQVVWQDEIGTITAEYGSPKLIFVAYAAYVAYVVKIGAAATTVMATAYVVVSGVTYIIESDGVKKEIEKLNKKVSDVFKYGGLYYDDRKGHCPNVLFLPVKGKYGYMISYKIKDNGNRVICHAKYQRLPSNLKKVSYETIGDN